MRRRNDLLDLVDALEAQVLETRTFVEGVRAPGRPLRHDDYQALKRRVLQFETVHAKAAAMLDGLPLFKRDAIAERFDALRGRMVAAFLDETLRFLTDLTDRRSLPLGMDAVLAGHAETIGSFRDILRARGYAHYLEWATPEMIDGLDALIAELRARVPAMEEF